MKLYTRDEIKLMLENMGTYTEESVEYFLDELTPIELPSDEDIENASNNAWSDYEYEEGNLYYTTFKGGWNLAIKWVIDKIKNQQQ